MGGDHGILRVVGNADQDTKVHDHRRSMRQNICSILSDDVQALQVSQEVVVKDQEEIDEKPNITRQVRHINHHSFYFMTT